MSCLVIEFLSFFFLEEHKVGLDGSEMDLAEVAAGTSPVFRITLALTLAYCLLLLLCLSVSRRPASQTVEEERQHGQHHAPLQVSWPHAHRCQHSGW